jgi:hypothetical protein
MTRRTWPGFLAALAAGAVLSAQTPAPPPPAQEPSAQPPVTFRAEINYVEVDARVLDAKGGWRTAGRRRWRPSPS